MAELRPDILDQQGPVADADTPSTACVTLMTEEPAEDAPQGFANVRALEGVWKWVPAHPPSLMKQVQANTGFWAPARRSHRICFDDES
jgi:hypothetical protein